MPHLLFLFLSCASSPVIPPWWILFRLPCRTYDTNSLAVCLFGVYIQRWGGPSAAIRVFLGFFLSFDISFLA